jgi:hypothetical protein
MRINVRSTLGNRPGAVWRRSPREHPERRCFIFHRVKLGIWLLLLVVACRGESRPKRVARASADTTSLSARLHPRRDSEGGLRLLRPRVITGPSVVVFWLQAGDTLNGDSAQSAGTDLDYYTEQVAPTLAANGITLLPTNADTVYVELADHERRAIVLSGLDYPYGYLLVDPGGPERILTGIYSSDALFDEFDAYFDLPVDADSTPRTPLITTD